MNNPLSVDPNRTALHKPEPSTDQPEATTAPKTALAAPLGDTAVTPAGRTPTYNAELPEVPGYEIQNEIARGAMGRVLAARDLALDREVAIKVILADHFAPEARLRFVRESKITARLPHPGVPPVYAIGSLPDGQPYLAMKLVGGTTLADQLKGRPNPSHNLPRFIQVFEQIAQTVAFAHAEGVIHRDLKPANIMVGAFGEVQVMDWGIAKVLASRECEPPVPGDQQGAYAPRSPEADDHTQAGQIMGSPAYMSPEQARGEGDRVDARSDVFSLGAMLCEILTGRIPFKANTAREVLQLVAACDLTEVSARLDESGGDAELIALTKRCLAPDPADRPANGKLVAEAVAAYRVGVEDRLRTAQADRAEAVVREVEGKRRRRIQRIAVGVVIGVLVLGIAGTAIGLVRADQAWDDEAAQKLIAQDRERDAIKAAEEERQAKLREQAEKLRAEKARDRTSEVLDAMTTEVTGDSLATQKEISVEQKNFLSEVLTYYKEFAGEKADDELSRQRRAAAAYKVGLIEYGLGRMEESATAFRMARDGCGALSADYPTVAAFRQDLARSHSNLGVLFKELGKLAEAESEYRQALVIQEKLAADFSAVPAYGQEMARSLNNLGILLSGLGKLKLAEGEYRKALVIQEKLAADFSDVYDYRTDLAHSHNNLGILFNDIGMWAEAEREYRKAMTIQEKYAAEFPAVPANRRELAASYIYIITWVPCSRISGSERRRRPRIARPWRYWRNSPPISPPCPRTASNWPGALTAWGTCSRTLGSGWRRRANIARP